MTRIAGIQTETDLKGNLKKITIDVKKHPQAINALKEAGILPKTPFEIECENAIPAEVVFEKLREKIKHHKWEK